MSGLDVALQMPRFFLVVILIAGYRDRQRYYYGHQAPDTSNQ